MDGASVIPAPTTSAGMSGPPSRTGKRKSMGQVTDSEEARLQARRGELPDGRSGATGPRERPGGRV